MNETTVTPEAWSWWDAQEEIEPGELRMNAALIGYEAGRAQGRTEAGHGTLAARAETLYTEALVWLTRMSATVSFAVQPAATPGEPSQLCTITLRDYYLSATGYEFLSTAQALKSLWEAADR